MTVASGDVTLTTDLSGRTTPYAVAEVRPQVSGLIRQRLFKEGAKVKAGQALYQIDPGSYQAARDQAAAQLASSRAMLVSAKAKAERYETLFKSQASARRRGVPVFQAALDAAKIRFRPIIMTSFAFIAGVLPMFVATGAGAASRIALGTAVIGGMLSAMLLAVFFVPLFFVVVSTVFSGRTPAPAGPGNEPLSSPGKTGISPAE